MDNKEPMLEMFIFETFEMIEQIQQLIIDSEKIKKLETDAINEIFRIMHTIKGSSGMMMFDNIANISHTIEDLFYFIRESKPEKIDYSILTDLVLEGSDLIKAETEKINNDKEADGDFILFIGKVNKFLGILKISNEMSENSEKNQIKKIVIDKKEEQKYYLSNDKTNTNIKLFSAILFFEEVCEMENIRAFTVIHKLKEIAEVSYFYPEDIIENNETCEVIKQQGFKIFFTTDYSIEDIRKSFMETVFLSKVDIEELDNE